MQACKNPMTIILMSMRLIIDLLRHTPGEVLYESIKSKYIMNYLILKYLKPQSS